MKFLVWAGALSLLLFGSMGFAVDLGLIEKDLTSKGVDGWVHGSIADRSLYVFTYRSPENFFDNIQMSLIPSRPEVGSQLAALARHDKVRVKGRFLDNPSPQKHISVDSVEVVKQHQSDYKSDPYQHEAKIPEDLLKANSALFLVHAIAGDGHILVVEFKDAVIPIFVKDAALTKDLFRNDIVELKYVLQSMPSRPTHLNLDPAATEPVKVVEAIQKIHGKPAKIEGALVLFPKSPEIRFNIFAVAQDLPSGLKRQYTLVNFEDPKLFEQIRAKLQKAWDQHPTDYVNGRNKLISRKVRVRATGVFNEVDPGQANPQVLLNSLDGVEILD